MRKLWQREDGLSLVEVVVATLLLGLSILTSITILATGMTVNNISRDKSMGLNLAEERMEYWTDPGTAIPAGPLLENNNSYDRNNRTFLVTVSGTLLASGTLERIDVVVTWTDQYNNRNGTNSRTLRLVGYRKV